ncbi:hypothetical protein [Streptomyces sp. NPDC059010]|uniref:hypothetical protein n=1 Tax=Streptomyces sp. NPDC059010 TaxID=3346695 RepID=UPI00369983ED
MSIGITRGVRVTVFAALTAFAVLGALLLATPAEALGDNRTVERSCGKNYVASGYWSSSDTSWAQTKRQSGTCQGTLSVAFERYDGYWTTRKYGDRNEAYTTIGLKARYGLHWGCNDCNVTRS